jgi:predicted HicB family RNase H-like nuclease
MEKLKRPRGRPPVDNGESLYLTIRVSEARKASYEAAAKRAGEALSAWVKRILDRASRR